MAGAQGCFLPPDISQIKPYARRFRQVARKRLPKRADLGQYGEVMYQALLHKIAASGARLLLVRVARPVERIRRPSAHERDICVERRFWRYYLNPANREELAALYPGMSAQEREELFFYERSGFRTFACNGLFLLADTASRFYNVVNHERVTDGSPADWRKTIYFFGNCVAVGAFAADAQTVASRIQRAFNEQAPDEGVRVVNAANWGGVPVAARQILSPRTTFQRGDVAVLITSDIDKAALRQALRAFPDKSFFAFKDISAIFQRPHTQGEIFFDTVHMNGGGYALVAERLFPCLRELARERAPVVPPGLRDYVRDLEKLKAQRPPEARDVGAIVMNANPFTRGHAFLVREALRRCDFLYVFILEEDKSQFSFEARFAMARAALAEEERVAVVPGGRLIISSETLPEYFDKDKLQHVRIDAGRDLEIFATVVAPLLGIGKRFAGEEPLCRLTRQYNAAMRAILPRHGIEFVELPRRATADGRIISASSLRRALKYGDTAQLEQLAPPTTLDYLKQHGYLPSV